jgi:DNA-binding NarL/FixJ family response regulator
MKVFIVEDSPAVRERLVEMIRDVQGMEVVGEADSFDTAVAGITRTSPDVAILDIKLANGRGTGIDVLTQIKGPFPQIRAIVLSNDATPQHAKASAEAGAEFFLDKTVDFERIGGILEQLQIESAD